MSRSGLTKLCVLPTGVNRVIPFCCDSSAGGSRDYVSFATSFKKKIVWETIMILITGASGNVGKTVLQEVVKSGAKHRAMYRSAGEGGKGPAGTGEGRA